MSDRIVMMSNGPAATVGEILEINLERPRGPLALAQDPEYTRLRSEVLKFLYEKQRKVAPIVKPGAKKQLKENRPHEAA